MTYINQFRLEASLESLMARVRPDPSLRTRCDVSFRIIDDTFIIDLISPVAEEHTAALPYLKGVTFDGGVTWRLFEQQGGQWDLAKQHNAFVSLEELLETAEQLIKTHMSSVLMRGEDHAA